jgi:hypothetical protein
MGAKVDHTAKNQPGNVFKINGDCHHLMGSLLPCGDDSPKFTQLYIYDVRDEAVNKLSPFIKGDSTSYLDKDVVRSLIKRQMTCSNSFEMQSKGSQVMVVQTTYCTYLAEQTMTQDNMMIHRQIMLVV